MKISVRKPKDEKIKTEPGRLGRLFTVLRSEGLIIVALIVGIYAVSRLVISAPDPAQVKFVESPSEPAYGQEVRSNVVPETGLSGTAYETAQRLREAAAFGMAVSLTSFATYSVTNKLPTSEVIVLREIVNRKLVPPGIEIKDSSIRSDLSLIRFRYRSEPFSFEVVSLPKNQAQGPAFLLKFPLPRGEPNSVMYFQSSNTGRDGLPAPFSLTEQLSAAGWSIRHWRGETLPLEASVVRDLEEHDSWLRSQIQSK